MSASEEAAATKPGQVPALELKLAQLEEAYRASTEHVRRLEAQVAELERLSQMGLMMSGVAHEINNLLTGAIGFAYLLGRQINTAEAPERRMLNAVSSELNRCAALTRGLVHYARTLKHVRQPVNLSALGWSVADQLRPLYEARGAELLTGPVPAAMNVMGNPAQIEAMLRGVLMSALDRLTLAPGRAWVRMNLSSVEHAVKLELADSSGMGETPSVLEPLLQSAHGDAPFGLIIAKAVMKEHSGKMELVRSAEGLVCTLRFPRLSE